MLRKLFSAVLGAWVLCAGCKEPPQQQELVAPLPHGETVRVYSFKDYFLPATLDSFAMRTGNKVVVETYETNEQMMARLAEGADYDIVFPSSYAVERLIAGGQIKPMLRTRVPNLGNVPAVLRNPPFDPGLGHCVPYMWTMLGLGLIVDGVHIEREPDQVMTLFEEKGPKVVMPDDARATIGMALMALHLSPSTRRPEDLQAAKRLLLRQMPRVVDYVDDPAKSLRERAVHMSLAWSTELFELKRSERDARFIVPREGTLFYVDYACVLSRSQHADVAFAFINHLLDPYTASEITNARMLALANQESRQFLIPEARWMWGLFDGLASRTRAHELLRDVGPAEALYDGVWREAKAALAAQKASQASVGGGAGAGGSTGKPSTVRGPAAGRGAGAAGPAQQAAASGSR